jgi:hypothetical protein
MIWWGTGFILGAMIAGAAGGSFITPLNRKLALPIVCLSAIVTGAIIGWSLNALVTWVHASAGMTS